MNDNEPDKSARIAALNDAFRSKLGLMRTCRTGEGLFVFTQGIVNLPADVQSEICIRVRTFDSFTEANNPYGEHDFGKLEVKGAGTVFWKIDYYSPDRRGRSEDPADLDKTFRILTVMLGREY